MFAQKMNLRFLILTVAAAGFLSACADQRMKVFKQTQVQVSTNDTTSSLLNVADVQFQNRETVALQVQVRGNSLYMTGRPFGFTRWEISPDPENPIKTFAASDNINVFSPMGRWVVDWYASGALEVAYQVAFTSGTFGLSAININQTNIPLEAARKPPVKASDSLVPSDEAYIYKAIIAHPSKPIYYGFRQQDYVYTVSTSSLALQRKDAYAAGGKNVCCVLGATMFNNKLYVAFGDRLVWFNIGSDGSLSAAGQYTSLYPTNVSSSNNYLYVQHEPIQSKPLKRPRGLYIFDKSGNSVNYIHTGNNLLRFAVSPQDTHVYANIDNKSLKIYRIQWIAKSSSTSTSTSSTSSTSTSSTSSTSTATSGLTNLVAQ